jgi:hypothetical protein
VRFQIVCKTVAAAAFAAFTVFATVGIAQQKPLTVTAPETHTYPVASGNNLYCAGFIQRAPIDTSQSIVGAVEEQEQFMFTEKNYVYISAGANKGMHVGDMLTIVRPRGQVKSVWTRKGDLGWYGQEVGAVEIVSVKPDVSVARIKKSCDDIMLGDLVQTMGDRSAPSFRQRPSMDLFPDPTGKAVGRLLMSRDNGDLITRDFIVYIDLGAEDNVQVGDYLTVFRPLGKGNPWIGDWGESASARDDFDSFEYRGGRFSNLAARKSGETAGGKVVTTRKAKDSRPDFIRKVVGEMVILNVKERTATAMITRTSQEIHPGDWVEVQ